MVSFKIRTENIVASTTIKSKIPLTQIASKFENAEYEPEQFPGLVYRMTKPRAAALLFTSGKIVCTGAKTMKDVNFVIEKIVSMLRSIGIKASKEFHIQVENIVASAKVDARFDLNKIAFKLENAEYEPEEFPGVVYRFTNPKVAFLFFGSGKIICTGARNIKTVNESIAQAIKKLKEINAIIEKK